MSTNHASLVVAMAFCLASAGAAGAATLSESSLGDFSGDFANPTVIANGAETIEGTWSGGNDLDLLAMTGLRSGAQTVTLRFSPITPIGATDWGFSAGGNILWKTTPFQYSAWEGASLGTVGIAHWNRDQTFDYTLNLDDSFGGDLWLGLFGTYGALNYSIFAPGNVATAVITPAPAPVAAPAPVPLPGAAPLLVLALSGLGLAAAVRRRRAVVTV